ncbi:MAG: copper chaperone PCu(A)C [Gammaproteobacteria bacterium]|jgi:copper(I)-binding protein
MLKNKTLFFAIQLFFLNSVFASENSSIKVIDAWISEAPPTVSVLAAYADIQNMTQESKALVSVSSPAFPKIELHLSKVINDTATMEKQESLTIPANSTMKLSPGAYHLMLFNPEAPLKSGDTVDLNFNFADGTSIPATATVKKRSNGGHDHHHHHH